MKPPPFLDNSRLSRALPAILIVTGMTFVSAGMMASSPPGSAPDEYAHYLKAAAAGRGDLVLTRDPEPLAGPGASDAVRWMDGQDKLVSLPARLDPQPIMCWVQPYYVGGCPDTDPGSSELEDFPTYVGRYPPYSYLIPGLAMRFGSTATQALYLGRIADLAVATVFLALATFALYQPKNPFSLMGLLAASTPMVLYLLGVLSSSSLEVATGICLVACLLRITRLAEPSPRWVWAAAAISGSLLALTRELGPVWVALAIVVVALLSGRRSFDVIRSSPRRAWAAGGAIGLSIVLAVAWQARQGAGSEWGLSWRAIEEGWQRLPQILHQAVGMFGALDTPVPAPVLYLWGAILALPVALAAASGTKRENAVLVLLVLGVIALAVLADAVQSPTGFRAQARHLMPAMVLVPLVAGEIAARHPDRLSSAKWLFPLIAVLSGTAIAMSWRTLAHRYAVGLNGPSEYVPNSLWVPAGGWQLWGVLMAVGVSLVWIGAMRSAQTAAVLPSPAPQG